MGTPFRKVKSEIRELLALQSNIAAVLDPLIKRGFNDFSPDIGVVNEYGAAPPQAPEVYEDGMSITLKPANTNTGPSTLSVNGMPRKPIVNADGTPLAGGEIQKDGIATVRFDGAGFRLISSAAGLIPKAWLSYDGVTPAIRASFNVSSVTDNADGDLTPVWDQDFADINYAMGGLHGLGNAAGHQLKSAPLVGSVDVQTFRGNLQPPTLKAFEFVTLIAIGNQ